MASWAAAYAILFRPIKVGNTDFSGLSSLGSFRRSTKSSGLDFGFGDALTDINKSMKKEKSAWQAASAVAGLGALIW